MLLCDIPNFLHSGWRDQASAARKGLETTFQCKRHPFEQTAMCNIWEWVGIEYFPQVRIISNSASYLTETTEEHCALCRPTGWMQVLRTPGSAKDSNYGEPLRKKRRSSQACCTDSKISFRLEPLHKCSHFDFGSMSNQFSREFLHSRSIPRAEHQSLYSGCEAAGATRTDITTGTNN